MNDATVGLGEENSDAKAGEVSTPPATRTTTVSTRLSIGKPSQSPQRSSHPFQYRSPNITGRYSQGCRHWPIGTRQWPTST